MVRAFSAFLKRHGSKKKRLEEAEKRQVQGVEEEAPRCKRSASCQNCRMVHAVCSSLKVAFKHERPVEQVEK